jgi:hypothetical protein
MPPGFTSFPGNLGTLGFLQVVPLQSATVFDQNGLELTKQPPGYVKCLDVKQNDTAPYPYYSYSGQPNFTNDSPGYPLGYTNGQIYPNAASFGAGGNYNMYLMFQPNTPNSIMVPLAVIPWSWSGGATLNGQNWTLTTNTNQAAPTGSIPAAVTDGVFPQWQSSCAYQFEQQSQ